MSVSVADRVNHRLPRPIKCDCCGGPRVHLQKRSLMKMRVFTRWDLVWHCLDCLALVGCHEGTDIPLGQMATRQTREARYLAHKAFDSLWLKKGGMKRKEAYIWMGIVLGLPEDKAHIGMLTEEQCQTLIAMVEDRKLLVAPKPTVHWKQRNRKTRRK